MEENNLKSESWALYALVGLTLLVGMIYAAVIPPWQAPDEPIHFNYIRFLHEEHRLPVSDDSARSRYGMQEEIVSSMADLNFRAFTSVRVNPGFGMPPIYYIINLPVYVLFASADIITQLYVLRFISVVMGIALVVVAFKTAKELFPGNILLAIGAGGFSPCLAICNLISS